MRCPDFVTGESPLIFSFDNVLSALADLRLVTPTGKKLPGKQNLAFKIFATGGMLNSSSYFVQVNSEIKR